jgi:CRP/FNR family transcriptional regulator
VHPELPLPGASVFLDAPPSAPSSRPRAATGLEALFLHPRRVRRRAYLFRVGEECVALHAVRAGSFKTVVLDTDGREQVTGWHLPGDILGLDGLADARHACEVVALEESEVCSLPFAKLEEASRESPVLMRMLGRVLAADARRRQDMMVLLGSMTAHARIASFLLTLAGRYGDCGFSSTELALRMTRHEIASYLGLTIETVSRIFSRMQHDGLLEVHGRQLKVLDPERLKHAASHAS